MELSRNYEVYSLERLPDCLAALGEGERQIVTAASKFIQQGKPGRDQEAARFIYSNKAHWHEDELTTLHSNLCTHFNRVELEFLRYKGSEYKQYRGNAKPRERTPRDDVDVFLYDDPKFCDLRLRTKDLEVIVAVVQARIWELRAIIRSLGET